MANGDVSLTFTLPDPPAEVVYRTGQPGTFADDQSGRSRDDHAGTSTSSHPGRTDDDVAGSTPRGRPGRIT